MNVLQQIDHDLGLVMREPNGDSVPVAILPEAGDRSISLPGKFDQAYAAVNPGSTAEVSSAAPTVFLRQSAVQAALGRTLTRRDRLRVDGRLYKPEEIQPDGLGLLTVRLREQ